MIDRPKFSPKLSKEEFLKYYWYKTELQEICTKYNLPTLGTKAELQKYIFAFLDGEKPQNTRETSNRVRIRTSGKPITLETRLIADGFKFDNKARAFFADYYNVSKFSFTKAMATALRHAEETNDIQMTVKDLIAVYENKYKSLLARTDEDATYQWNNFLKDFHSDSNTKKFLRKHQIASLLWRHVRDNPGEKKYTSNLLQIYAEEIQETEAK